MNYFNRYSVCATCQINIYEGDQNDVYNYVFYDKSNYFLNFTITKVTITFTNGDILLLKICQGRPWEYDSKRH